MTLPVWASWLLSLAAGLAAAPLLWHLVVQLPWRLQREWLQACAEPAAPLAAEPQPLPTLWCGFVTLSAVALAGLCFWRFGVRPAAVVALMYGWTLLVLAVIDQREMLLPDNLTQPLLWCGLLVNLVGGWAPLPQAVLGAVTGYLCLWLLFHGFRLLTGREGMGYGDFKLLAAIGAWVGVAALPSVILLASFSGLGWGLWLLWTRRAMRGAPQPFGVHLAWAGVVMLLWLGGP